jgi:hypothetical protein
MLAIAVTIGAVIFIIIQEYRNEQEHNDDVKIVKIVTMPAYVGTILH